jgi:hypothetical protein
LGSIIAVAVPVGGVVVEGIADVDEVKGVEVA